VQEPGATEVMLSNLAECVTSAIASKACPRPRPHRGTNASVLQQHAQHTAARRGWSESVSVERGVS
jgi:hypothetical protein